jgi:predicted nucleic acid-binding protein
MPLLKYLADTNALSDVMRQEAAGLEWFSARQAEIAISTLSLAEIRAGIELKPEGKRRRELERDFEFILEDFAGAILVFDEAAAFEWGRLMRESKDRPLAYHDSLLAACARSMELQVVTRNIKDFSACETVDPWTGMEYARWSRR